MSDLNSGATTIMSNWGPTSDFNDVQKLPNLPDHKFSILSWNIHDSVDRTEGAKINNEAFASILAGNSIFCLQETKGKFNHQDYRCYNSLRSGSRSGGICVGIHRALTGEFKEHNTESADFQAISIKFDAFEQLGRFTLINVYDSPEQGSFKARIKKLSTEPRPNTLEMLLDFYAKTENLGEIFLCGDFNARTASMNFETVSPVHEYHDSNLFQVQASSPTTSNRKSRDEVINARGKLLLDFLSSTNLSLLNGCMVGDILGEFTSLNYRGQSVVDYMATSGKMKNFINNFRVMDLTSLSDHKPCLCTFNHNIRLLSSDYLTDSLEDAPVRYNWKKEDQTQETQFHSAQTENEFQERISKLLETKCTTPNDVMKLNDEVVKIYKDLADTVVPKRTQHKANTRQGKKWWKGAKRHKMKPKSPWFDEECINTKLQLRKAVKLYGKTPTDPILRDSYYRIKRVYQNTKRVKKDKYVEELCNDIEAGHNINWSRFSKLKQANKDTSILDAYDMKNFCNFFKDLYSKPTLETAVINNLTSQMSIDKEKTSLNENLDATITLNELKGAVRRLKNGKAVAEDLIANEFVKTSNEPLLKGILHLFNQCLHLGVYPWSTSVVTPLHKKGDLYDPNNYRAIAVASNLGKLFASILLQRLLTFRQTYNPDTPNQLGFCKAAQTCDHIFTLSTCIEKYIKKFKDRLYTCFIDYAKAFDSVCREALLYKLWKMGIQGKFFRCIEYMYKNSKAKIKLLNKLSEEIDIACGTEQGHPLSPELFKCFIHQLSEDLNSIELEDIKVPRLNNERVTHLLWADDLVLLACDPASLQKMLDILVSYCVEWGLTVNLSKTAVMVFNRSGRLLEESKHFTFGDIKIPSTRDYCYLGITFNLTGSLKATQVKLKQKAMRGYFSLKKVIDMRCMRKNTIHKLFDILIVPIASYGCQVWLPETWYFKDQLANPIPSLQAIAKDPLEILQLSVLKWTMGVHKKTSNSAVWGDAGRYPIAIELSKQVFNYLERLEALDRQDSNLLARHAFCEQKYLNLSWYKNLQGIRVGLLRESSKISLSPTAIRTALRSKFQEAWESHRLKNKKLSFYNSIKTEFDTEPYLSLNMPYNEMKHLARLRTSSHRFNIESGRYATNRHSILSRICRNCSCDDWHTVELMAELPMFNPIVEDELHILRTCTLYEDLRQRLSDEAKSFIFSDPGYLFRSNLLIKEIARFLKKIDQRRFPKINSNTASTEDIRLAQ